MGKCALPEHIKNRKHDDWIFPLSLINRGFNARGPRCPIGSKSHEMWPPKLIEGFDVNRWEWSDLTGKNHTHGIIEPFKDKLITSSIYQVNWNIQDLNTGETHKDVDLIKAGWIPSVIQLYSRKGYLKCDPSFSCKWDMRHKLFRYYWRCGWRADALDMYYNWGPFLGRNFE